MTRASPMSTRSSIALLIATSLGSSVGFTPQALAQNSLQSEDNFREVFMTAGYSAAFGAAMGAALLPFFPDSPLNNLRYVAGGASLGFIFGSAFAFYNIAQNNRANSFPSDQDDGYGPYDNGPGQGYGVAPLKEEPLPTGALIVGRSTKFAIAMPAIRLGKSQAEMNLFHIEF